MSKGEDITTRYKVDISDLKKGISQAIQQIKLANAQFNSATAGIDNWSDSVDGVSAKLKQLNTILENEKIKLANYRKQYIEIGNAYKENKSRAEELKAKLIELANSGVSKVSEEYKNHKTALTNVEKEMLSNKRSLDQLKITYENQKAAISQVEKNIRNYSSTLNNLEIQSSETKDATDELNVELKNSKTASETAKEGFTIVKGALADLVASGFRKAINAAKTFAKNMITTAAEVKAEEAQFSQTFGNMGNDAEKAINRVANSTGILDTRLKTTGANIYAFARANKGEVSESLSLMEEALQAAADNAAYYDKSLEESAQTLQSFLKGNYANDAALGVSATEYTRNSKAVELFGKKFNELTEFQKQQTLLKMVTDSQKLSGAFGQASRESDGWENVMGNLNETWRQFQAHVGAPFLEALIPVVQKVTNNFKDWSNTVDWDAFGEEVENAFDKVADSFGWILKNGNKVKSIIKLLIAAFITKKVNDFGNRIINLGKNFKSVSSETKLFTNITKSMTLSQKASTVATNAATIATKGFNATLKANPIGAVVIALELLVAGYKAVSKHIKDTTKNTNEHYIAAQKLEKEQNDLNQTIKDNTKARQDNLEEAEAEAGSIDILFKRLTDLEGIEGKSNTQKALMKEIVQELNELIPDLNLKYDEEKDKLNQTTDAIKNKIDAQKELIKAEASAEQLKEIAKEQVKSEIQKQKLLKEQKASYEDLAKANKEYEEAREKWQKADPWEKGKAWVAMDKAEKKVSNINAAIEKTSKALQDNKANLESLNAEYDAVENYSANAFNAASVNKQLGSLISTCEKAGRKIPESISQGIQSGNYAIPKSIKELDRLIQFDNAMQEAKKSGLSIPESISQGIIQGKITVEQAIQQVNEVTKLINDVQARIDDGKAIPEDLAEGIKNGSVSLIDANKILLDSIKYDHLEKAAKAAGVSVPKGLAEQIKKEKITVEDASNKLQDVINFNDAVKKAEKAGIDIPTSLQAGIDRGILEPKSALDRVQALLDCDETIKKVGIQGLKIPKSLSDGILNGEISIQETNKRIDSLINFNQSQQAAIDAGIKIPEFLQNGILNGELTVEDANSKMNDWIRFNEAVDVAKTSGVCVSDEFSKNVASGKINVETATAILQRAMSDQLKSTKNIGIDAGGNLVDGTAEGISDKKKQLNVLSIVTSFGGSIIAALKKSLDEHSPSKESRKIAHFFMDGFGFGAKDRENGVLKQISNFGKSVVKTLNDEINKNDSIQTLTSNIKGSISKMKTSVNGINIPQLDSANLSKSKSYSETKNINYNYNQIINAAKQPSRRELYRHTKNLLSLKGGD